MTVSERLARYRWRERLSLSELASKLGVSKSYLHDVERGKRPLSPRLASAMERVAGWDAQRVLGQVARERMEKYLATID